MTPVKQAPEHTALQNPLRKTALRLYQAWRLLCDGLLPPRCPVTGRLVGAHGTLDPALWGRLQMLADTAQCACCGRPFPHEVAENAHCGPCLQDPPPFAQARAAMLYDDVSARVILKFKHADGTHMVPVLMRLLQMAGRDLLDDCTVIVPVPLHRWRLLKRRYNQAALLSAALARTNGKRHVPHGLRRIRATESQGHKNAAQRLENVQRAFAVTRSCRAAIAGQNILLIDDVLTSGATVRQCAHALLDAGAAQVSVLTLARVR